MHRLTSAMLAAAIPAALAATLLAAPAATAAAADIVINEVQSNDAAGGPDWFELTNTGTAPMDISGWIMRDNKDGIGEAFVRFAPGTVVQPGAFVSFEPDTLAGVGLGANDSVRIYLADGSTLIDSASWTDHAFSEGLLPDGTGTWADLEPTRNAANTARVAAPEPEPVITGVVVNEVQSDDAAGGPDWVELRNNGAAPVDVSGWILKDNDPTSELRIAAGTTLAPGGYLVVETSAAAAGFGLGKNDEITVLTADGLGLVDQYAWTEHAFTEGRLPDGTGAFVDTEPTRGAANLARFADSPVVINEIESNGDPRGDWVELANTDTVNTMDLSGWSIIDGDPSHTPIVLPAGTTIESGGYHAVITDASFGLGGTDSVTLRDAAGAVVDAFSWTAHADTTYGRCADMTGAFATTAAGTFELANDCGVTDEPVIPTEAWPFADNVRNAVAPGTWGEDMSGLDYAADGTLFAVNNDNAEIFKLLKGTDGMFTIGDSWIPTYTDGSGQPDAEGITVAGDGAIFLSTERDNLVKGVSRPSVLRVVLGADGSTTTNEWNLTPVLGALGANAGIEGIEWISDTDAQRLGVKKVPAGSAYNPAEFPGHFGGIFAVAVEQTGDLHLIVLQETGEATILQATKPGPAASVVMGLDWQAGGNALWALCDDACNSASSELAFVDGVLTVQRDVAAPTTMPAGYTNEGLAIEWCDVNPAAVPTVAWISDTDHDGVSLRVADGGACEAVRETPPGDSGGAGVDAGAGAGAGAGASASASASASEGVSNEQAGSESLAVTGAESPLGLVFAAALLLLAGLGFLAVRRRTT
jgi:hypothetical protein